jgi:hypothetical protein
MVKRSILVLSAVAVVVAAIAAYVFLYLTKENVIASASAAQTKGAASRLYLATVAAAATNDPHPTWVSYYQTDSQGHNWKHNTTYVLPANSLVHVTIFQFDGNSGLRNPFLSQAQGTVGGTFTLNNKTVQYINPNDAAHIFAVPELGVSVPLQGIADDAKNACGNAPCPMSDAHNTITFTFRTGARGIYRWQCFVPCGAGTVFDFGGPMQTVGYMDGFLKVV